MSLAFVTGCRCGEQAPARQDTALDQTACASACAALVGAGCDAAGLGVADQARCVTECLAHTSALAPAGCDAERRAYLGCVSTAKIDCELARCSAAMCLQLATGIQGCAGAYKAQLACVAPCIKSGTVHTKSADMQGRNVRAELTTRGCVAAAVTLREGAPEGSACQAASVCAEHLCQCEGKPTLYSARVCVDGKCLKRREACELAPAATLTDPCDS